MKPVLSRKGDLLCSCSMNLLGGPYMRVVRVRRVVWVFGVLSVLSFSLLLGLLLGHGCGL